MNRRPSIRDVAALAGVSITTVSHTLSGKRPVSDAARARVETAAAELGYRPSRAAQALKTGSNQTIGVFVPDITNHFFAELAHRVEQVAWARGYHTVLGNTGFDPAREASYLGLGATGTLDGLVYVAGSTANLARLEDLAERIPIVLADEEIDGAGLDLVLADHRQGGRLVGELLAGLDHRSVLVVTGPDGLRSSDDRLDGFRGSFPGRVVRVEGDFRRVSGAAAVGRHPVGGPDAYSAVFALNDLMAIGVIEALNRSGVRVPDEVAVVGYDDIPGADLIAPSLTTIRQPAGAIGTLAVELLLDRIEGDGDEVGLVRTVVPVELVERDSTGPRRPDRET